MIVSSGWMKHDLLAFPRVWVILAYCICFCWGFPKQFFQVCCPKYLVQYQAGWAGTYDFHILGTHSIINQGFYTVAAFPPDSPWRKPLKHAKPSFKYSHLHCGCTCCHLAIILLKSPITGNKR